MSACGAECDLGAQTVVCSRTQDHNGDHAAQVDVSANEYDLPWAYVTTARVTWAQMPAKMRRQG